MKTILASAIAIGLATAPLAYASGTLDDVRLAVQSGSDFGLTHFQNIEFDDDQEGDNDFIEIEGWLDNNWYVELDMARDGTVTREDRRKRDSGPKGLTADETLSYVQASAEEGMTQFDEIDVDDSGRIEVEGDDNNGRELEIDFRTGNLQPVKVERDD